MTTPTEKKEEERPVPPAKREKREWLASRGPRHPRVGDEYQVTSLPTPKAKENVTKEKAEQ